MEYRGTLTFDFASHTTNRPASNNARAKLTSDLEAKGWTKVGRTTFAIQDADPAKVTAGIDLVVKAQPAIGTVTSITYSIVSASSFPTAPLVQPTVSAKKARKAKM